MRYKAKPAPARGPRPGMAAARRAESAGAPRCVRGMEPAPGGSRRGVVELREELQETKPSAISGMGTGGDIVEEDRRSEAEQGAADEGEQGQVGAGARGPVDPEKEEGGGGGGGGGCGGGGCGGGGGWEPPQQEQQLQEPSHVAPEDLQPCDRQPGLPRHTFTGLRLKGLESVFQRTQYPDVFSARKELAFLLDVAEPRAQVSEPEHAGDSAGPPV